MARHISWHPPTFNSRPLLFDTPIKFAYSNRSLTWEVRFSISIWEVRTKTGFKFWTTKPNLDSWAKRLTWFDCNNNNNNNNNKILFVNLKYSDICRAIPQKAELIEAVMVFKTRSSGREGQDLFMSPRSKFKILISLTMTSFSWRLCEPSLLLKCWIFKSGVSYL